MTPQWIGILGIILGAIVGVLGKIITANTDSRTQKSIKFYDSLSERVKQLEERAAKSEKRTGELEKELERWRIRYWSLYRWSVKTLVNTGSDNVPPTFHDMEGQELKETIANMYQKEQTPNS